MTRRDYGTLLGLACCVSSSACGSGQQCTEIGCLTYIQVELVFQSEVNTDEVEVTVRKGDQTFVCEPGADQDPCHKGFGADFFPGQQPEEGSVTVLLDEAPEVLELTVVAQGSTETVTVRPEYSRSQPNGPDCPSTCYSATNRVVLSL